MTISRTKYKMLAARKSSIIVGISGATCSGKTTIANTLHKVIKNSILLNQDQFYWEEDSEKHILAEGMNHINWEVVSAFDNDKLLSIIKTNGIRNKTSRMKINCDSISKKFNAITDEISNMPNMTAFFEENNQEQTELKELQQTFLNFPQVIIVDGILVLNHPEIVDQCDIKFFLTLDFKTCLKRRDLRTYDPPDVPGYFEKIVYPHYVQNLETMKYLDGDNKILYLDGANDIMTNFKMIVSEIIKKAEKINDS